MTSLVSWLAWLGNTMFTFLAVAGVPICLAATWHFANHKDSGLGIPIAILLGTVIIVLLGVFPLREAFPRLESQRQLARQVEKRKLDKLQSMRESALTKREREDRSHEIAAAEQRILAVESASAIVMGRFGVASVAVIVLSLAALIVSLIN